MQAARQSVSILPRLYFKSTALMRGKVIGRGARKRRSVLAFKKLSRAQSISKPAPHSSKAEGRCPSISAESISFRVSAEIGFSKTTALGHRSCKFGGRLLAL
jgi:hypothetical protein